jgi:transposase
VRGYSESAWERAMKVQEVILQAMAKRITWWQAAEIIGISDRSMRRWRQRYEEHGYDGLLAGGEGSRVGSECRWRGWKRCCGCTRRNTW